MIYSFFIIAAQVGGLEGPVANPTRVPQAISTADADLEARLNNLRRT
jgi:hypothetical protein